MSLEVEAIKACIETDLMHVLTPLIDEEASLATMVDAMIRTERVLMKYDKELQPHHEIEVSGGQEGSMVIDIKLSLSYPILDFDDGLDTP